MTTKQTPTQAENAMYEGIQLAMVSNDPKKYLAHLVYGTPWSVITLLRDGNGLLVEFIDRAAKKPKPLRARVHFQYPQPDEPSIPGFPIVIKSPESGVAWLEFDAQPKQYYAIYGDYEKDRIQGALDILSVVMGID